MSDAFVTAINCMDGRVQEPVIAFLKTKYSVDYVDMIAEPGPNKILAEQVDYPLTESIKKRFRLSVYKHESTLAAVVGHHDCAGNPAGKERQIEHVERAMKLVQSWDQSVQVIGLWVDENWEVSELV